MRTLPGNVDEATLLSEGKKYALTIDSLTKQTKMISIAAHNAHDNVPLELHPSQHPLVVRKKTTSRSTFTRKSYRHDQKVNTGHSVVASSGNEGNKLSTTNTFRTVSSNPQLEAKIVSNRTTCDATKNDHVDTTLNDDIDMTTMTTMTTKNDKKEKHKKHQNGLVTGWFKTQCRNIFPTLDISRSKSTNTNNTIPPNVDVRREDSKLLSEQPTDKTNGNPGEKFMNDLDTEESVVSNNNQQSIIEQFSSVSDYERRLLDDELVDHFLATPENASQEMVEKATLNHQTSSNHQQPIHSAESRDPVEYTSTHDSSYREDYGDRYHTDVTNSEERGSAVMTTSSNLSGIAAARRTSYNSTNTRNSHGIIYPSESRNPVKYSSSYENSYRDDYEDRYHTDVTNSEKRDLNVEDKRLEKTSSGIHNPIAVATATGFKSINKTLPNLSNTVSKDELVPLSNYGGPHSNSSIMNGDHSFTDRHSSGSNNNCTEITDRYATEEESRGSYLNSSSDKYTELIMNSSSIESDYKSETSPKTTGVYISNLHTENGVLSPCPSGNEESNSGSSSQSSYSSIASSYDENTYSKFNSHCSSKSYDEKTFLSSSYHSISKSSSTLDSASEYTITINKEYDEEVHIPWCFRS